MLYMLCSISVKHAPHAVEGVRIEPEGQLEVKVKDFYLSLLGHLVTYSPPQHVAHALAMRLHCINWWKIALGHVYFQNDNIILVSNFQSCGKLHYRFQFRGVDFEEFLEETYMAHKHIYYP